MTVLFSSDRPLDRAENLKAVWDAYDGEKEFMQFIPKACNALSDRYSVFVVDCTPQYSKTKGNVKTVFVSHGMAGDKKYGLDFSEGHRAGVSQIDYAICTTEYSRKRIMSQLGLPRERVLSLGFPMTDRYYGKSKGGGTVLADYRRAYFYAPTWRTADNPPLPSIDWEKLDGLMDDDEFMVVKRHMCSKDPIVGKRYAHIREFGNMEPSAPFVIDCDVLATDFSSILFDAYAMGKPSVLVTDGADGYISTQGMYEDYPSWYGSRSVEVEGNEEGFLSMLRDAFENGIGEAERKCAEIVVGECDGKSSERVARLIGKLESGKMKHAVYCATRNIYGDMETAAKSLIANSDVDVVHFIIEDAEFPHELPEIIQCHDVSGQEYFTPDGANTNSRFTWMEMMRAVLCHIIDADKVLSLDCDTICISDVSDVWDIDVEYAYFAATPESWARERPGLFYCNIGVMLQNLENMRECGKADEIVDVLNNHYFAWPCQDALNYLCQGFIANMPSGFNKCPWVIDDWSPTRIVHYAARNDWRNEPMVCKYRDMSWDEVMKRHRR